MLHTRAISVFWLNFNWLQVASVGSGFWRSLQTCRALYASRSVGRLYRPSWTMSFRHAMAIAGLLQLQLSLCYAVGIYQQETLFLVVQEELKNIGVQTCT